MLRSLSHECCSIIDSEFFRLSRTLKTADVAARATPREWPWSDCRHYITVPFVPRSIRCQRCADDTSQRHPGKTPGIYEGERDAIPIAQHAAYLVPTKVCPRRVRCNEGRCSEQKVKMGSSSALHEQGDDENTGGGSRISAPFFLDKFIDHSKRREERRFQLRFARDAAPNNRRTAQGSTCRGRAFRNAFAMANSKLKGPPPGAR